MSKLHLELNEVFYDLKLPGSIAAEISDCASRTLFIASSISLLEVSDFRLGETRPAATWFSLVNKQEF